MKRRIRIFLGEGERPIGTLLFVRDKGSELSEFTYADTWLEAPDRFAIDPKLPLTPNPQYHKKAASADNDSAFPGAIADTEPDGFAKRIILRNHALKQKFFQSSSPINSLDSLLAADDFSRNGALRFKDETGCFQGGRMFGRQTAPRLYELDGLAKALRAVESGTETETDLNLLHGCGTSLGGLRPKCSVLDHDGMLAIAKFPSEQDTRAITKGEVLAMRLAKKAGINAVDAQLEIKGDVPVSLIRRFDRSPGDKRLMYVSAATLLGVEPSAAQEHTYSEIVDALRMHGADAQTDIEELWRRIAFSILITNVDDHLRNHGFLHVEHGLWRLAPAFDINPSPESHQRELKTWISPDTGPEASIDALMSVTAYYRISMARAKTILRAVETAVATWQDTGRSLGMTTAELDKFADAFEHQERKAARQRSRTTITLKKVGRS